MELMQSVRLSPERQLLEQHLESLSSNQKKLRILMRLAEDWPVGDPEQAIPHTEPPFGSKPGKGEETAIAAEAPAASGLLSVTDYESRGSLEPEVPHDTGLQRVLDPDLGSRPRRKRGRPAKIGNALKEAALQVKGGKLRAQIIYQNKHPTPQQVKNVSAILRYYKGTRPLTEG
jgi:hypothetical protein